MCSLWMLHVLLVVCSHYFCVQVLLKKTENRGIKRRLFRDVRYADCTNMLVQFVWFSTLCKQNKNNVMVLWLYTKVIDKLCNCAVKRLLPQVSILNIFKMVSLVMFSLQFII